METPETTLEAKVLAKGAGITLISKLGSRGLLLIIQILLARLLGPSGFGLFSLGQVVLQIISQGGTLGLATGAIRFGVPSWQLGLKPFSQFLRNVYFVTFVSSLVFGGGGFLLAPWLATEILKHAELEPVIRVFSAAAAIMIWLNVLSAITRISKRMQYSALALDLVPPLANLILLGVIIYGFRLSVLTAAITVLLSYASGTALSLVFIYRLFPGIQTIGPLARTEIRELLGYSIPNLFSGIFNIWLPNVTILFLGYFLIPKEVGIFQAAEQISSLSAIVLLAFNTIFSPQIAELYVAKQHDRLNELFTISTTWGLYISLPLLVVVVFMPTQVMSVAFGNSYRSGAVLLMLLMGAQFINTATGAVGAILSMTHHQNRLLVRTATAFVVCVLLNLWFIPMWGTVGAALALASGISLLNLSALWDVRHLLRLWPYDARYYKMGIALLVDVPLIYLISRVWSDASFLHLALITLLSVAVFAAALALLGLEQYEVELFSSLRTRLGRMFSES